MALTSCTMPTKGEPTFDLGPDEMEIGIGIHGEPGRKRMGLKSADEITEILATGIIEDEAYTRELSRWDADEEAWVDVEVTDPPLGEGDRVLAMVNSMGGTPEIELPIVYRKLHEICEDHGLEIVRNLIGRYITSLEMEGVSITLLKMDDEMIELWDEPVKTQGLRWGM
jgi:dihydroxyacetone kinase-like protein